MALSSQAQRNSRIPRLLRASIDAFRQPDLRSKLLFTFAMLVVFRFLAHVPMPNVNQTLLKQAFASNSLLNFLNFFSGGGLRRLSVAAMGVYPYITAQIVVQLVTPIFPRLKALTQEGEQGQQKLQQYTAWMTVPMAAIQGYAQLQILQRLGGISGVGLTGSEALPTVAMISSMVGVTMFLVWLGQLIDERGIGNGVSVIIFAGIIANLPSVLSAVFNGSGFGGAVLLVGVSLALVVAIVIFNEAQRRVPVQYARSLFRGGRMYRQSGSSYVPLRVNSAGMIPLLFAFTIMTLPQFAAQYFLGSPTAWVRDVAHAMDFAFNVRGVIYQASVFTLTVAFTFFYTMVIYQQQNLAENLQKQGGFIPGIRPGRPTNEYILRVLTRITWAGALFLGLVAVVPFLATRWVANVPALTISSTGFLIVVGVVIDTMKQLEAQLLMRTYEGFIR